MIGIRADANETIGSGHIMRCITIAGKLRELGEDIIFFAADRQADSLLGSAGMKYHCLNSRWDRPEEELPALLEALQHAGCDKLLVDSYRVGVDYLSKLSETGKLIYIDDLYKAVYPVSMIINYNAYHARFPYQQAYGGAAELLLGPKFVPLRECFLQENRKAPEKGHIFLNCGGGDICNALVGILKRVVSQREEWVKAAVFHTVAGSLHPCIKELEGLAAEHAQIKLYHHVSDMAAVMGRCEAAVSAAGTVLYELCAMGVPTVFFMCADNQQYDSSFFAGEDRMMYAGDIRADRDGCIDRICLGLRELITNGAVRAEMQKKLRGITDGKGAVRIAKSIVDL